VQVSEKPSSAAADIFFAASDFSRRQIFLHQKEKLKRERFVQNHRCDHDTTEETLNRRSKHRNKPP
jgi:hypothetical protein